MLFLVPLRYVKGDSKGWYPMILCRVTLGRLYYCATADPTTDPGRDKLEDACTSGACPAPSPFGPCVGWKNNEKPMNNHKKA